MTGTRPLRTTGVCLSRVCLLASLILISACGDRQPQAPARAPNTLYIGYGGTSGQNELLRQLTTEGLVRTTAEGRHEPRLAESWSAEQNGHLVLVTLRPGVTFHDRKPLDATVVKAFLDAARVDPRQLRDHPTLADIRTIEVVDDLQFGIHLEHPSPLLLDALAIRIEREENGRLLGTGPFALQRESTGALTLVANPTYHRGRPSIDVVHVRSYPTVRTAWAAMMRREIDFLFDVPISAREFVAAESSVDLFMTDRPYAHAVVFNARSAVIESTQVRQALNYAVDRSTVIEHALRGDGRPASGIWPSHWVYGGVERIYGYDPTLADRLLTEAGFPPVDREGSPEHLPARLRFTCLVRANDSTVERIALLVQRQLYDIGVDMQIEALSARALQARVASGGYDAALVPQNVGRTLSRLYIFWHSSQAYAQFGYTSADEALAALRRAATPEGIVNAASAVQSILYEDPPAIFLAAPRRARAASQRFAVPDEGGDIMETVWRWRRATPAG